METFLSGLALIAIGALATTAIKNPKGYGRLYWGLLGVRRATRRSLTSEGAAGSCGGDGRRASRAATPAPI